MYILDTVSVCVCVCAWACHHRVLCYLVFKRWYYQLISYTRHILLLSYYSQHTHTRTHTHTRMHTHTCTHTHTQTPLHIQEKASATFVGFANLPNQVFRKSVKRGFQFSLMVVGKSLFCTQSSSALPYCRMISLQARAGWGSQRSSTHFL